jgi:hypothetical protein
MQRAVNFRLGFQVRLMGHEQADHELISTVTTTAWFGKTV